MIAGRTARGYAVVIPTRDRPGLLERALRSVARQTVQPNEVWVVDDGSALVGERVAASGLRPAYIRLDPPSGAGAARNAALDRVDQAYLAFLDDDDEWLPGKMAAQLQWLEAHPEAVGVSCARWLNAGLAETVERFEEAWARRWLAYDNFFGSFSLLTVRWSGPVRDLRLAVDLPACQDWDFVMRLAEFGRVGLLGDVLCRLYLAGGPRITTAGERRVAGYQAMLKRHGERMGPGGRRWLTARVLFLRAEAQPAGWRKVELAGRGLAAGLASGLPLRRRLPTLMRWCVQVFAGFGAAERIKVCVRRWLGGSECAGPRGLS